MQAICVVAKSVAASTEQFLFKQTPAYSLKEYLSLLLTAIEWL